MYLKEKEPRNLKQTHRDLEKKNDLDITTKTLWYDKETQLIQPKKNYQKNKRERVEAYRDKQKPPNINKIEQYFSGNVDKTINICKQKR